MAHRARGGSRHNKYKEVRRVAKENLFDDITLEEAKAVLQRVSEYADEVIEDRRIQVSQQNMKRDDLLGDPGWNFAHDVLEIIHFPEAQDITLFDVIEEQIEGKINERLEGLMVALHREVQKGSLTR